MIRYWYAFWIWIYYALRLRGPVNWLQIHFKGEHKEPTAPIPNYGSPSILERAVRPRFQYRRDETRVGGCVIPLDWVTKPEVFQSRLNNGEQRDGDCDDYAAYVAHALSKMEAVEEVYLLIAGYAGGGHTACVFKRAGKWSLFNYEISPLDDPNDAPEIIALWGTKGASSEVKFYVFETVTPPWRAVAMGTSGRVPA